MATLDENEVQQINLFSAEAINNPFVEGIILFPYKLKENDEKIDVNVILNNSLRYCLDVSGEPFIPKQAAHLRGIKEICSRYNFVFRTGRISYTISNINNYNVKILHHDELSSIKRLLSSVILFDRFGDIHKRQNHEMKYVNKYDNTILIDNINQVIIDNSDSNKCLKKEL